MCPHYASNPIWDGMNGLKSQKKDFLSQLLEGTLHAETFSSPILGGTLQLWYNLN